MDETIERPLMLVSSPGIKPATFCFWAGNDGDGLPAGHRRSSGHQVQAHRLTQHWASKLCTLLHTSDTITVWPQPPSRCDYVVRTTLSSYYGLRTRTPRFPERRVGARSGLTAWVTFCPAHPYGCAERALSDRPLSSTAGFTAEKSALVNI